MPADLQLTWMAGALPPRLFLDLEHPQISRLHVWMMLGTKEET